MSLRRRGNTWELRVYVPDEITGKSKQRSFTITAATEREAKKEAAIIKADLLQRRRLVSEAGKSTFAEFAELYLSSVQVTKLKAKTQADYRYHLEHYVVPRMGSVRLEKITASMLDRMYGQMLADGLSARTVELSHAIIRRSLSVAVRWKALPFNPADDASPPRPVKKPKETWSPNELREFLAMTREHPMGLVWRICGIHGLRRGEVLGLRWRDVDFEANTIQVTQQVLTVNGAATLEDSAKTAGSARTVHLDQGTMDLLRERYEAEGHLSTGLVFDLGNGKTWHPDSVSKAFSRETKRRGFPSLTLHGLRHTAATLALRGGIPLKVVSERLGHASVAITGDIYQHVHAEVHADAAEKIAALIEG